MLGRLLFLRPDTEKEQDKEDYYCLLSSLFVPWSRFQPPNLLNLKWEDWYLNHTPPLIPRLHRVIRNLSLLHKSKDEVEFNRLQRESLDGEENPDSVSLKMS